MDIIENKVAIEEIETSKFEFNKSMNDNSFPSRALRSFAYVDPSKYEELARMALEEKWFFGDCAPDNNPYPLLKSYLNYTFYRLKNEKKIKIGVGQPDTKGHSVYVAFNTGLVNKVYEDIYAVLTPNDVKGPAYWNLRGFYIAGQDFFGKMITKLFNPLPQKADYFNGEISNILYDTSSNCNLVVDYDHIIRERIYRFPKEFVTRNVADLDTVIDGINLDYAYRLNYKDDRRKAYFVELGERIKKDANVYNRIKGLIEFAKDLSIKRVGWNYKTAVPTYYPKNNIGSLLLPLALVDNNKADLALVVEKQANNAYLGHTVLTLDMAYINSRLITRPDSDWLQTQKVTNSEESDD